MLKQRCAHVWRAAQDVRFDKIVGVIEDTMMDPAFQGPQEEFCKANCGASAVAVVGGGRSCVLTRKLLRPCHRRV